MSKFLIYLFVTVIFLISSGSISAQNAVDQSMRQGQEIYEGKILKVLEEKEIEVAGIKQLYQKLEVLITGQEMQGEKLIIENGNLPIINLIKFQPGDEVKFTRTITEDGSYLYYILDYLRRNVVFRLFLLFIVFVVAIGRWRGIASILGMLISFTVIIFFILPQLLSGKDPVLITILGAAMIIPPTFLLSHGFNKKTTAAIIGTIFSLTFTGILTAIFVRATRLSGLSSEEAGFLSVYMQGNLDIKGLLYAGIIIGALGVMDDITVSQSAIVEQLKKANPVIRFKELYFRAMAVGQDHIASMVNTLVLVYTGAALPLLLLFIKTENSFREIIDFEIVTEEIVRTLVGSIGLILAVPVTTLIACLLLSRNKQA